MIINFVNKVFVIFTINDTLLEGVIDCENYKLPLDEENYKLPLDIEIYLTHCRKIPSRVVAKWIDCKGTSLSTASQLIAFLRMNTSVKYRSYVKLFLSFVGLHGLLLLQLGGNPYNHYNR